MKHPKAGHNRFKPYSSIERVNWPISVVIANEFIKMKLNIHLTVNCKQTTLECSQMSVKLVILQQQLLLLLPLLTIKRNDQ